MRKYSRVYQFKITLKRIRPPIWRRIQVPETYTFWDLHVAIQDAMGWWDDHLHEFEITDPITKEEISIERFNRKKPLLPWEKRALSEYSCKIADYFSEQNPTATYTYDFGDNWEHTIKLEKILPRKEGVDYPICVAGRRACPPEDCGGAWGYEYLLEVISDPNHREYEDRIEWLGGEFDPEDFDPKEVHFSDPGERRKSQLW